MLNIFRHIVDYIVQIGGWFLLAAAGMVTYDVITRKLLNISIAGADEISGYVFAISTACAFSYALLSRANIRIDLIYNLVPDRIKRVLDILSMAMTAGFLGVISYYAYGMAADSVVYGSHSITPLQTPLAVPQVLWVAGLGLALVVSLALLASAISALLKGNMDHIRDTIGIPSLNEEIEIELSDRALKADSGKE